VSGVTKVQFLAMLAVPFKEQLIAVTGAVDATITRVVQIGGEEPAAGSTLRRQMQFVRQLATGVSVEVDVRLQLASTASMQAAEETTRLYILGTLPAGGNGLLEDLQAAAPALAEDIEVDSTSIGVITEELTEDATVEVVSSAEPVDPGTEDVSTDGDGEGGGNGGAIAGAVIGSLLGVAIIAVGIYYGYHYYRSTIDVRKSKMKKSASIVSNSSMYGGDGLRMASNPLRFDGGFSSVPVAKGETI